MSTKVPPHPSTFATVGELVAELLKLDQSCPVVVSTHYDNGVSYSSEIELGTAPLLHQEHNIYDPDDNEDAPVFVLVTGNIY